ncbi:MAG: InlB B-repeat-containing protein [Clostridia bacterium]|nr:InlB B-repeat-containing protein [Clostridia bacterium]
MRYYANVIVNVVGYGDETVLNTYKIKFHGNGGMGNMEEMTVIYNEAINLTKNTFVLENYNFGGWNTEPDGSGTYYGDEQEIIQTEDLDENEINLYAQWTQNIARIGSTYYSTLKDAIQSVASGNTATVYLLTNTNETQITPKTGATVLVDLQGHTFSNYSNNDSKGMIEGNKANLTLKNGSIVNDGVQGTLNNSSGGTINLDNVSISVSAPRQAIYNQGGTVNMTSSVTITGSGNRRVRPLVHNLSSGKMNINGATITDTATVISTSESGSTYRMAAVANVANSVLTITDATITSINGEAIRTDDNGSSGSVTISGNTMITTSSSDYSAINHNNGTMNLQSGIVISTGADKDAIINGTSRNTTLVIGVRDGNVDTTSPVIQGKRYGVSIRSGSTTRFYDGIVRGASTSSSFSNESIINELEGGKVIEHNTNTIEGFIYDEAYLVDDVNVCTITLHANGGQGVPSSITCTVGSAIGTIPTPTREQYSFDGWFDAEEGGNAISASTVFNADDDIWAHWTCTAPVMVNGVPCNNLTEAIAACPDGVQTTITIMEDSSENLIINSEKDIIIDLNNHTLSNSSNKPIIENHGKITTLRGTLTTNASAAGAIDNMDPNAKLIVEDATVVSTGGRQVIYNESGYVEIKGDSHLSSVATGIKAGQTLKRGTINNCAAGTLVILGGLIECSTQSAVSSSGTLIVGTQDGSISNTNPVLIGYEYGILSDGTVEYYDGISKGTIAAIQGTVGTIETGTQFVDGTETIDGDTYQITYLEIQE